jgi:hypothetical protein
MEFSGLLLQNCAWEGNMKRLFGITLVILTASLFGLASASAQQEDACYAKNGNWNAELQKCEMQSGIVVNVTYPLELVGSGVAEQTVDTFLTEAQTQFLASYAPDLSLPAYANYWSMNIDYELYSFSANLMTVKLNIATYTGGAHGNLTFQTFTFDLAQQREIILADLFVEGVNPLATVAPLAQQNVLDQLGEGADPQWVQQGTSEDPLNYQSFALTPDSLLFFFPPYQVTAYAYGSITVAIPLLTISPFLKPEFVSQANG